jgi:hypothetical protein
MYLRKTLSLFSCMCMLMCSSSVQKCFDIKRVESLGVGSSEASLERLYTCATFELLSTSGFPYCFFGLCKLQD